MALKGDLASVDLAQVFQMLALNQKVGMLSIEAPRCWKALYFDPRGVTLYFDEHVMLDQVLASLVRAGHIDRSSAREVCDHAADHGTPAVDSLLAGGYLTEAELRTAFRHEIEEEIYDLFFWRDARFEFYEGATSFEGRAGVVHDDYFFTTDSLIMEAARRIDEWTYIRERVASADVVYRAAGHHAQVLDLSDAALSVFEVIDGKRNVERLVEVTAQSSFHVYKSLAQLLDEGLVEEVRRGELIDAGRECIAEGRLQDAINLFERSIAVQENVGEARRLAAQAYEAAEEFELSVYHLKAMAESHVAERRSVQAVDLLRHAVQLLPTDLAARERIVELTVGAPEFKSSEVDVTREGKVLVDLYLEMGEIDRVRGILERLLRDNPDDIELKKSLVNVHSKAGDTRRVIELYESIADDLVRRHQPIEAVKYLQKVLMIDRQRKEVSERIRRLYEMDERRRSRRRSMVVLSVLFVLLSALGGAWYLYEQHARERFDALDVEPLLAKDQFDAAAGVYNGFLSSYPLTLVARDAKAALARIDSLRMAYEAQQHQNDLKEEAARNKLRARYKQAFDHYSAASGKHELDEALRHLEECRALVTQAGRAEDDRWAEKVQLDKLLHELQSYIGDAAGLERSARELLAQGDWRRAREHLLALIKGYDMAAVSRRVRIPALLASMPTGAEVWKGDAPVTGEDGKPLITPAVVWCARNGVGTFQLKKDGFEPLDVRIDAQEKADWSVGLTIVPAARIDFGLPVQGGVGAFGDNVVVSLRGGRIGLASTDHGVLGDPLQLTELREMQGAPLVAGNRFYYRTNESELVCRELPSGNLRFSTKLQAPAASDPTLRDGRLFVLEGDGNLSCIGAESGQVLWRQGVVGGIAGRPQAERRWVRVATQSGAYVLLDVLDGKVDQRRDGLPSCSTGPVLLDGAAILGTTESTVIAIDESTGQQKWSTSVGRVVHDGEIVVAGGWVFVAMDDALLRLNQTTGEKGGELTLPGRIVSGPLAVERRLYVVARQQLEDNKRRDVLIATDIETLQPAWEFHDGGLFRGPVSTDGAAVFLPDSHDAVLQFR